MSTPNPSFNKDINKREASKFYIPSTQEEIDQMLKVVGATKFDDLFAHISDDLKFGESLKVCQSINYEDLSDYVHKIANKNIEVDSFIGDGLHYYEPSSIVSDICSIRGLTTAYTPYQPERSQGTLQTLWNYQSAFSKITGYEAINASLYDRSTGLFEAIKCGMRANRNNKKVLILDSLYPGDKEVLLTLIAHTGIEVEFMEQDSSTGTCDIQKLKEKLIQDEFGYFVFSQVTNLGTLEKVDELTDISKDAGIFSIAIIDPMLINNQGLKPPSHFGKLGGTLEGGPDVIIGESQTYALDRNFGGPGLGLFGVRYNEKSKRLIRQTPGRYVGLAKDINGTDCKVMILSTREQHIRRDKATSNICSNQSFVASLAGANILLWGSKGLSDKILKAKDNAEYFIKELEGIKDFKIAFKAPSYNEITFEVSNHKVNDLIEKAYIENLEIGVNVSDRINSKKELIKIFFSDLHSKKQLDHLISFLKKHLGTDEKNKLELIKIDSSYLRTEEIILKSHKSEDVINYYKELGESNFSPDDGVYPLGSCTMKYNPWINDHCASFKEFTNSHPQTNEKFVQGNLQILFEIQELFKSITGLSAVTTQPVAGAQGELVGLKLFQAYHKDHYKKVRDIVLIPQSAHGTNPATAVISGMKVVTLKANERGQVDILDLEEKINTYNDQISAIMVTNPNTSGIFEENFKLMADKIHACGGLVYMDGANMNAIAGQVNLQKLGVDAVHNNLHKTWTIPHGGGGPGDAIVAVSEKLVDYLPGIQVELLNGIYKVHRPKKTIGSFHRHYGNFAHKVRCYTYIKALGTEGIKKMSAMAVLSSLYLYKQLNKEFPTLPAGTQDVPRMHEFIITLSKELFEKIEASGTSKPNIIARVGKTFLDFGFHAPTVAFPEIYGLMIEPTESFTKKELDDFLNVVLKIKEFINESPEYLIDVPKKTPISRVDEVNANKKVILNGELALN